MTHLILSTSPLKWPLISLFCKCRNKAQRVEVCSSGSRSTVPGATELSSSDKSILKHHAKKMLHPVPPNLVSSTLSAGFIRMETPYKRDIVFTSQKEIRFFCESDKGKSGPHICTAGSARGFEEEAQSCLVSYPTDQGQLSTASMRSACFCK